MRKKDSDWCRIETVIPGSGNSSFIIRRGFLDPVITVNTMH